MPKALGIHWNVVKDTLHISTPVTVMTEKVTKRSVASDTAKIFDILGLRPCDHNSTGIASFTVEVSIEVGWPSARWHPYPVDQVNSFPLHHHSVLHPAENDV